MLYLKPAVRSSRAAERAPHTAPRHPGAPLALLCALLSGAAGVAHAADKPATTATTLADPSIEHAPADGTVRVYGAGGPQVAFQQAATAFEKATSTPVEIVFGPESTWSADAQADGDLLWGTAEQSITAFLETYTDFSSDAVEPLYLRPAVIAVKPGNPKGIESFEDLLADGIGIVVVEGAGVSNTSGTGVWEDIAARLGRLDDVVSFRSNIIAYAKGSGAGFEAFQQAEADAWITWSYWPIDHPDAADAVPFADDRVIYRDINVVASPKADPETLDFVTYLKSDEAQAFFEAEGMFR